MNFIKKLLLNNVFIGSIIVLNTIVLFLDAFDTIQINYPILYKIDLFINFIFIGEMLVKVKTLGWRRYIQDNWNKVDFCINLVLLLMLVGSISAQDISLLVVFRTLRIVKFFKFFKYVPNISHLIKGLQRALKASLFVFCAFFIYLLIISFLSCFLFRTVEPHHFGNPFLSLYSCFKIFTIEGWDVICEATASHFSSTTYFFTKLYFILIVLSGGVFGVSIVNAVFVDEMISDNNDELNRKVDRLIQVVEELKNK